MDIQTENNSKIYRKGLKNPFGYGIILLEIDKGVVILWQKKKKN